MKCLIIHTSYRQGNTYKVSSLIKSQMQTNGPIEFEELFLSQLDLPFCLGCNNCFLKGENTCPHSAIIQPIVDKIMACQGLIITTPTYSMQVPGLLKCWLDHMSYNFHRPRFFDKKALIIVTTAGAGANDTAHYLKEILSFWGFNHISLFPLHCFSFDYTPDQNDIDQFYLLANKFYHELSTNKLHRPSLRRITMFNFWRAMAKSGQRENTTDYLYWVNSGLLEKTYPPEIPLGIVRKAWALFTYDLALTMID